MEAILHKLCEKSQAELWDLLKEPEWTKDHAEVAFYMLEILKGVKKIEHLEKVQEAMERAEEMGEQGMEHMLGKEENMHHYARGGNSGGSRGGRSSGGRGSGGRSGGSSNYSMFNFEDDEEGESPDFTRGRRRMSKYGYPMSPQMPPPEWDDMQMPPVVYTFAAGSGSSGGSGGGNSSGGGSGTGGNFNTPGGMNNGGKFNAEAAYYENKYRELLEDKWEKEKKEKEKEREREMGQSSGRATPPPPPPK